MKTLICKVDLASASISEEYASDIVKFSDGYEQRKPKGIAPVLEQWNVSKTGRREEVERIRAFLREHGGYKSFLWQPCDDEPIKKWVADKVNRQPLGGGLYRLSWQMREVIA